MRIERAVDVALRVAILEPQRRRIDTVAQAGRLRTVLKDMAEMGTAMAAMKLRETREPANVIFGFDIHFTRWLPEPGPTRPRIKLRPRIKQLGTATDATVHAGFLTVPVLAGERALGPFLASHLELFGR